MDAKSTELRHQLVDAMRGHQAHIEFDSAVKDFPVEFQGAKPDGIPHSAWELLEHMRIAQYDILEFCRDPNYQSPEWPEGYWPKTETPPTPNAWSESVKAFRRDNREFLDLLQDSNEDLFKPFEHGDGQNLLREALLIASHNSYHIGQLVFLKKMLASKQTRTAAEPASV
jgi:DinB superfamily